MATPFKVQLVTPDRVLFSGDAEEVTTRTDGGEIAFLAHHEDFIGALDVTVLKIAFGSGQGGETETTEVVAAVHGGFAHVSRAGLTILAGVAELSEEIDVERARRALADAEARLQAGETATAEAASGAEEEPATPALPLTGVRLALLAPESAEARAHRATARLEAAGAAPSS